MSEKVVTIGADSTHVAFERDGSLCRAGDRAIEVVSMQADQMEIRVDDRSHIVPYSVDGSTVSFAFDGEIYFAEVTDPASRSRARHRDHSTAAPMPGQVLKILVREGDVVTKGTPLVLLEAMKMEHPITAGHDGTVVAILCREGEMVQPGVELVTLGTGGWGSGAGG